MSIDAFDQPFDQPPARVYKVVPEGRAEVEIRAATIGTVPWKISDANPTGACLQLRLSAGREYSFVFADLPRDRKFLFRALAAALGIQPGADGRVSLPDVGELVGRTALVEIGHFTNKRGETKARVVKWLPASTAAPAPATAAWEHDARQEQRQPRQQQRPVKRSPNAAPPCGADDDIPFVWLLPFVIALVGSG